MADFARGELSQNGRFVGTGRQPLYGGVGADFRRQLYGFGRTES